MKYIINPDRTVTTVETNNNKTLGFAMRLDSKYPTPYADNKDKEELIDYDEHKFFN